MTLTDSARSEPLSTYMSTAWSGDARYDGLDAVMAAIAEGAQQIQQKLQAATLAGVIGTTGETNVQGEIVQLLDTAASDTFVDVLSGSGRVAAIGCEEIDDTVVVGDGPRHSYIVQMDPLDGSSNIDVAVSIGSIFGIWSRRPGEPVSDASLLRPGKEQVAAAYVVYGSSTVLVVAIENSVQALLSTRRAASSPSRTRTSGSRTSARITAPTRATSRSWMGPPERPSQPSAIPTPCAMSAHWWRTSIATFSKVGSSCTQATRAAPMAS